MTESRTPKGKPPPLPYAGEEDPTRPQGIEFRAALLVKYWKDCAAEDQAYLIRLAERLANRNQ